MIAIASRTYFDTVYLYANISYPYADGCVAANVTVTVARVTSKNPPYPQDVPEDCRRLASIGAWFNGDKAISAYDSLIAPYSMLRGAAARFEVLEDGRIFDNEYGLHFASTENVALMKTLLAQAVSNERRRQC